VALTPNVQQSVATNRLTTLIARSEASSNQLTRGTAFLYLGDVEFDWHDAKAAANPNSHVGLDSDLLMSTWHFCEVEELA
jgi:hypothetical protein